MQPITQSLDIIDLSCALTAIDDIARGLDDGVRHHLERLIAASPAPGQLIHYLTCLRQKYPQALEELVRSPFHARAAATVFAQSRFLSEDCLAHPDWLLELGEEDMRPARSAQEYSRLLREHLDADKGSHSNALALALFRRRQILRILLRDVLGFAELAEITEELSNLADAILEVSYQHICAGLAARYGMPRFVDPQGRARECGMCVIALGKLGGRELNYSSDIDLMFVYSGNGETDGEHPVSNKEFFKKVANRYTELLSTYTNEGMCYRVDLRLRPDGSLGEVCISLDGALKYFRTRARDWELQMLIKARPAAGDSEPGRELLGAIENIIYSTTLDFSAVEAVSVTRERISEKLAARRPRNGALDIKLAPGGIRDIEFLVQCLQRLHGGRVPWVRHGGTLLALSRLSDKGLLSPAEHNRLASAYHFLRDLEHRLQFADDRQTHTIPSDPREQELLARRMPSSVGESESSASNLLQLLNAHLEAVQEIYERVIHAQRPMYYSMALPVDAPELPEPLQAIAAAEVTQPSSSNLVRYLDELAPALAKAVARCRLTRGAALFESFLEKLVQLPDLRERVDSSLVLSGYIIEMFEHSRYFAEQFVRVPELVMELSGITNRRPAGFDESNLRDTPDLRRFFRRNMLRIQAASICLRDPIFETLSRTSKLADFAIRAAYRMALAQASDNQPEGHMMVIALGRLGMREFDLSSDADLVFVLPDKLSADQVFWTRVASRIIEILSAYTGDGQLFAVDTRLRPNGNAGPLVQSEAYFKDYFDKRAEAWEGLSYMKARAVAGDVNRATDFLHELQELDWRRYGQGGRSRADLRAMRQRLEKEQGSANPLKAGRGGYYDIDFLLLYLRLKGAGFFYKALNTPARIDVIEKMGHLDRPDAAFLRDAATFYRAIDHGLRLYSGHASGTLPAAEAHLEAITGLVNRWIPERLHQQPLPDVLAQFRRRTRDLFDAQFS